MTEDEVIESARALLVEAEGGLGFEAASCARALAAIEEGLRAHPGSARLWCARGDLIPLGAGPGHDLADAQASYEQAIALEPDGSEGYASLGCFLDAIQDDPARAEEPFRRAIALGAGDGAVAGLARVLAQLGRRDEALRLLDERGCEGSAELEVVRGEILDGLWDRLRA